MSLHVIYSILVASVILARNESFREKRIPYREIRVSSREKRFSSSEKRDERLYCNLPLIGDVYRKAAPRKDHWESPRTKKCFICK